MAGCAGEGNQSFQKLTTQRDMDHEGDGEVEGRDIKEAMPGCGHGGCRDVDVKHALLPHQPIGKHALT